MYPGASARPAHSHGVRSAQSPPDSLRPAPPGSGPGEESAWDTAVSTTGPAHFRPDIEGLRAVAILAVLAYHARLPWITGGFVGVDVFFVISGFLITGLLLREFSASGRIDLPAFYARRARRLLPAALVVIAVTVLASALIVSPVIFPSIAGDGAAAALYVSNYRFALSATDYFAAEGAPSPLLHYWSLAVEEQFYLFWPLLILVGARYLSVRRLWILVAAVGLASLVASVVMTNVEAPWAFYSLPTRAWQLALGGLVALGVLALPERWPAHAASALGAVGMLVIVASVVLINDTTPFPGLAALAPAIGTASLIVAGEKASAVPARLLAMSIPRWFGRISYSLYLWHWPLLILVPVALSRDGPRLRIALAVAAIVLAALSTRFIERPFRTGWAARHTSRWTLAGAGAMSVLVAVSAVTAGGNLATPSDGEPLPSLPPADTRPELPRGLFSGPVPADLQPPLLGALDDKASVMVDGCRAGFPQSEPRDCVYGNPDSPTTVVLFGDSHAAMWQPAIERIALDRDWRIVALIKPACPPVDVVSWSRRLKREFTECHEWRDLAIQRIASIRPSITFVASAKDHAILSARGKRVIGTDKRAWKEGLEAVLVRLREASERVVLIGEVPHLEIDALDCLAEHRTLDPCVVMGADVIDEPYERVERRAARRAGVQWMRTTRWICPGQRCPMVRGNYLVYRDRDHLTATFAGVLAANVRWALDHPQ